MRGEISLLRLIFPSAAHERAGGEGKTAAPGRDGGRALLVQKVLQLLAAAGVARRRRGLQITRLCLKAKARSFHRSGSPHGTRLPARVRRIP